MFEALMLICFGASWPASIYKSWKIKKVTGKSPIFLWLVFIGYACGLTNKILTGTDWVTAFYAINGSMVFIDILLYYRYSSNEA